MQNPETPVIVVGTTKPGKVVRRAWLVACLSAAVFGCADLAWAQPVNDDCVDALPIPDGSTPFSTIGATTDGPSHSSCQFDGQTYEDIWYRYTASCTGNLTVSTCNNANYDTDLVVYDGCDCQDLVLLDCNDDHSGCSGYSSEVTVPVVQSNCYLIRVGGWQAGNEGTGTVTLGCAVPGDGACCHEDDTCTYGSMQECVDAGGEFSEGILCDPNPCLISGPDVIYNNIGSINHYGPSGGIHAYVLGSYTCNIGDEGLAWINNGTPGLAMNAYRLYQGRLEQIGMSWVKHACCVSNGNCGELTCSSSGIGLRPGCRDIYGAGWNAGQGRLGARSSINPFTGAFQGPSGGSGDSIYKRLQIAQSDLDQSGAGALYFAEGLYVGTDDAQSGNGLNNASYKRVTVSGSYVISETGLMNETIPAIYAWFEHGGGVDTPDPSVEIVNADVLDEGRFIVAGRAGDNGDGTWRYAYAVFNLNSHRSGGSFSVPISASATVTNVGFNDVDYHSGEPYDNTDWPVVIGPTSVTWSSPQTYDQNPDSNALRWGTMYTFWFDVDAEPAAGEVTLGLFRPGTPALVTAPLSVPANDSEPWSADFDHDGDVDMFDYLVLVTCFDGSDVPVPPECQATDGDGDEDVDAADYASFQQALTGPK